MRLTAISCCLVLAVSMAFVGCNEVPIASLEKSLSIQVERNTGTGEPIKIDFLWVIDNSSSMCEEQVSLAGNFETFRYKLNKLFELDPHIAVVTNDMHCDPDNPEIKASMGQFSTLPAGGFPPACQVKVIKACTTDSDCEGLDATFGGASDGEWDCQTALNASCVTNPNGSVNTECKRRCTTDEECQDLFGDDRYECLKVGGQADWGCLLPPKTEDCPDELPAIIDTSNIDLFPCLATVGVNQNKCFHYEQGLASALAALDPLGDNAAQAGELLRPDAYLVIIFVSDEDDCSAAQSIHEDYYDTCALLPTLDEGGPLVPVAHYANRFKALKADPSKVIVAAIAGDAVVPSGPQSTSQMLVTVRNSLLLAAEDCTRKCVEGTWSASVGGCIPDKEGDCQIGDWDDFTKTCEPNPQGDIETFADGTTSKPTCAADTVDAADPSIPVSGCVDGLCVTAEDEELRVAMVGIMEELLDAEGAVFFADPQNPSGEEIAAFDAVFLADEATPTEDELALLREAYVATVRQAYIHSKSSPYDCYETTYVCESDDGRADWGSRYFELADRFGPNGIFTNICASEGIGPALDSIAQKIINIVNRVCLPKPVLDMSSLKVTKTYKPGDSDELVTEELVLGEGPGTYQIVPGGEDCRVGDQYLDAIIFGDEPVPDEKITVTYQGDPLLDV